LKGNYLRKQSTPGRVVSEAKRKRVSITNNVLERRERECH